MRFFLKFKQKKLGNFFWNSCNENFHQIDEMKWNKIGIFMWDIRKIFEKYDFDQNQQTSYEFDRTTLIFFCKIV